MLTLLKHEQAKNCTMFDTAMNEVLRLVELKFCDIKTSDHYIKPFIVGDTFKAFITSYKGYTRTFYFIIEKIGDDLYISTTKKGSNLK